MIGRNSRCASLPYNNDSDSEDLIWGEIDKNRSEIKSPPISSAIIELRQFGEEPNINRKSDPLKW
ncbi:hypothetical protein NQ314_004392 [Rhamnusium bicolor]|uniref:Uncharacterized protein n=1 Tax=Rhamnusium bicolor TaxID=1586634 RepID=A0AAV8ZL93_9CUCU|nr:hypothetical protein NQ314_004392 [Rhamnusium bicolor]